MSMYMDAIVVRMNECSSYQILVYTVMQAIISSLYGWTCSVGIIFFGNFQITRLYYPKFLATKNPNNNFMRNNILKCVHSIYTCL